MLPGLAVLGDAGLELPLARGDNQDTTVSRCSSVHVLDEVSVSWSINDGDVVSGNLKLPENDVDGDSPLSLPSAF